MTFYLKPPIDGSITTNLYLTYTEARLKYLTTLRLSSSESTSTKDSSKEEDISWLLHADCLIEGSAKDRVSHFALRSLSILHPPLHSYVIQKEELLFRTRLSKMTYNELETSVKILAQQLRQFRSFKDKHEAFFRDTERILHKIVKQRFLSHYACLLRSGVPSCPYHEDKLVLAVPFQHVLPLMAKREIELKDGQALLRCDQVEKYLRILFTTLLDYSSNKIRSTRCIQQIQWDPRLSGFLPTLKKIFNLAVPAPTFPTIGPKGLKLSIQTLDELSNYFPPCMNALHRTLRSRHRLCHKPRVQYTLFLKDIGLPVDHCLQLIQMEYSKPAQTTGDNQKHKCEHSWNADSRRYRYGTRHLYGLEGARKEYSSHSCHTIQRDGPGPNECGGCPFVHYDENNLQKFLTSDLKSPEDSKRFISHVKSEKITPIESCHFHLRFKSKKMSTAAGINSSASSQQLKALENSQVKIHSIYKPKHYYSVMSNIKELAVE